MGIINILDDNTINLIAAGEVVERPASVVKELVENAIDAGADKITVEIKQGGIEFIRITDNGCGIDKEDIPTAFLRHATSKIKCADDLLKVASMGFRGEALSSISSVARVELITKKEQSLIGYRYEINGGKAGTLEEIGAPDGTTIIVRNLFFNTPARRKFLKSETSEGNTITDVMEHLALGRPDISFRYINNGKQRFETTGSDDIREIIYRLYGRDTKDNVIPINYTEGDKTISGYLGTPANNRSNRNFETYFINKRYVHNDYISHGIEEGYKEYIMQHKFPFCVLHLDLELKGVDVNVHPAKLEVRFFNQKEVQDFVYKAVFDTLTKAEMIPDIKLENEMKKQDFSLSPEHFEEKRIQNIHLDKSDTDTDNSILIETDAPETDLILKKKTENSAPLSRTHGTVFNISFEEDDDPVITEPSDIKENIDSEEKKSINEISDIKISDTDFNDEIKSAINQTKPEQMTLFEEEKVLSEKARKRFKIIGQVFDTYWIIEYGRNVYFMDQHAAHEKVNYERIMKRVANQEFYGQLINPPIVISLSGAERQTLSESCEYLKKLGFDFEEFGGNEISLTSIPSELFFNDPKSLFLDVIDELSKLNLKGLPDAILGRIATMACKASVKGGDTLTLQEVNTLLDELLTLENPYNCPHGRPTMFSMSEYELQKKFKRIVD